MFPLCQAKKLSHSFLLLHNSVSIFLFITRAQRAKILTIKPRWYWWLLSSHSVMSDSLRPHGLQHTRLPCPSPSPGACSNSCPLSGWCHPTILSSVVPFYRTMALISHTSKVILKNLQARLQQYMNQELPDVQDGFRKGRGTRDQIANICWIINKARKSQKNIFFCFIDYAKAFVCVYHKKLWKILTELRIPDHLIRLLWNMYTGQKAS